MRILFVQLENPWPIRGGQQLHAYNMMRSLAQKGSVVRLVAPDAGKDMPSQAERGWEFTELTCDPGKRTDQELSWWRSKWLSYWGLDRGLPYGLYDAVQKFDPDVVVGVGLRVLPVLCLIRDRPVIWYAADEWVLHYLSLFKNPCTYTRIQCLKNAFYSLLYERTFVPYLRGVVVVSPIDSMAMRWLGGAKEVAVVPNGVDLEKFIPSDSEPKDRSLVFWGRMDYDPNVDAVQWFHKNIFKRLRNKYPEACLTIVGANPTETVLKLGKLPGVQVTGEVADIRPFVRKSSIALLPMRTGFGIRNKLLEACALGMPSVVSPRSAEGLCVTSGKTPWLVAKSPNDWIRHIESLWEDKNERIRLGLEARSWVEKHHNWALASESFYSFLDKLCHQ